MEISKPTPGSPTMEELCQAMQPRFPSKTLVADDAKDLREAVSSGTAEEVVMKLLKAISDVSTVS